MKRVSRVHINLSHTYRHMWAAFLLRRSARTSDQVASTLQNQEFDLFSGVVSVRKDLKTKKRQHPGTSQNPRETSAFETFQTTHELTLRISSLYKQGNSLLTAMAQHGHVQGLTESPVMVSRLPAVPAPQPPRDRPHHWNGRSCSQIPISSDFAEHARNAGFALITSTMKINYFLEK